MSIFGWSYYAPFHGGASGSPRSPQISQTRFKLYDLANCLVSSPKSGPTAHRRPSGEDILCRSLDRSTPY